MSVREIVWKQIREARVRQREYEDFSCPEFSENEQRFAQDLHWILEQLAKERESA